MTYLAYIIYGLAGIFAGLSGGLFGVGGGLVVVPILLFTFNFLGYSTAHTMQMAIGTSLAAMVFTSASSAWAHYKKEGILWKIARSLAPGIVIGAIIGALIADYLPSKQLEFIFGLFVCVVGIFFLIPSKLEEIRGYYNPHFLIMNFIGVIIGGISSLFGIGGGIITVPILTTFRVPLKNAISTSAFTGFIIAIVGAFSFLYFGLHRQTYEASFGYIYFPAFISIGIVSTFVAPYGAKLAYALSPETLRRIFGIYLMVIGIIIITNSY